MTDQELGQGKTCFVVSPIGDALAPLGSPGRANYEQSIMMWSKVFEPACTIFGLTVVRADKIADPGEIPNQIFTYLRDSEVVIADVSGANPNVMYELGLRHSRSSITIQVGEYERLPFDVTTIRTIQFVRDEAGLIDVRNQLVEALRVALTTGPTDLRATAVFTQGDGTGGANVADDARRSAEPDDDVEAEEPGIVEVLAAGEEAIIHISRVLSTSTELMTEIGEITQAAANEIQESAAQTGGFAQRLLVTRRLAEELVDPSSALEVSANEFFSDLQSIDGLVRHVIARVESGEEDTEEVRSFIGNIETLVDAAEQGAIGITTMRDSSTNLRRISSSLKDVSRAIERALNRMLEGIRQMQSWRELIADLPQGE